jgi:hypothetical protein
MHAIVNILTQLFNILYFTTDKLLNCYTDSIWSYILRLSRSIADPEFSKSKSFSLLLNGSHSEWEDCSLSLACFSKQAIMDVCPLLSLLAVLLLFSQQTFQCPRNWWRKSVTREKCQNCKAHNKHYKCNNWRSLILLYLFSLVHLIFHQYTYINVPNNYLGVFWITHIFLALS